MILVALPLQIQTAIVKSSICLSTVKAGYRFNILRNESASIAKSSKHQDPWSAQLGPVIEKTKSFLPCNIQDQLV